MLRHVFFTALLWTLSLGCFGQTTSSNSRWRLITTAQCDTIVQGPYREFVNFAAKRSVQDNITRTKINTLLEKNKQLRSYEVEVNALKAAMANQGIQLRNYRDSNTELQETLMKCVTKGASKVVWATIGKVTVVIVVVVVIVAGVATVLYLTR